MIFQLCLEGNGPGTIARILTESEVKTPGTIKFERTGQTYLYHPDAPCSWVPDTVADILDQDTYLGRTTNFKTTKLSYKSKKKVVNPPEKQITFENTHEAIIDMETWELVRKIREQRHRPTRLGEMGMFSGLAFCADCGAKLYHCRAAGWTHEKEFYNCSHYRTRKGCSAHRIRAVVLEQLVLQDLQRVVAYAQDDEDEFIRQVMENKMALQTAEQEQAKRQLEKQERRINELDSIIQKLFESNALGKLTDERFAKMSAGYEKEQAELQKSCAALREIVDAAQVETVNIQSFLKIVRRYTDPAELTPAILREFVDKIVVHEADRSSGHRVQRIDIHYNFIGEINLSPEFSSPISK